MRKRDAARELAASLFPAPGFILLVTIYAHNEKDNLSPAERRAAAAFIDTARKGFDQRKTR